MRGVCRGGRGLGYFAWRDAGVGYASLCAYALSIMRAHCLVLLTRARVKQVF